MKNSRTKEELLHWSAQEVKSLLVSYQEYIALQGKIDSGVAATPRIFSFLGGQQNLDPLQYAKEKLKHIGEGMKFQSPMIWLQYKAEAYKQDPTKSLTTLADLVAHCGVDGICSKRFDFINTHLRDHYAGNDLRSNMFISHGTKLEDLAHDPRFVAMCLDQKFQEEWSANENDPTGKWANYRPCDHDAPSSC